MAYLDELIELDLHDLASHLLRHRPTSSDLSAGESRSLLELFTSRMASADRLVIARNWRLFQQAYDVALAAGRELGDVDPREEVLRRVNLLVVLTSTASSDGDVDELTSRVRDLALRHVSMPLDEAQLKSSQWQSLSKDEIRDLRYLKNLFVPLRSIVGSGMESPDSRAVERWIALLPALP